VCNSGCVSPDGFKGIGSGNKVQASVLIGASFEVKTDETLEYTAIALVSALAVVPCSRAKATKDGGAFTLRQFDLAWHALLQVGSI
jgi:hypothetical protein